MRRCENCVICGRLSSVVRQRDESASAHGQPRHTPRGRADHDRSSDSMALSTRSRARSSARMARPPRQGQPRGANAVLRTGATDRTRTARTALNRTWRASHELRRRLRAPWRLPRIPSSPLSLAILGSARPRATGFRGINDAARGPGAAHPTRAPSVAFIPRPVCACPFPSPVRLARAMCPDARR